MSAPASSPHSLENVSRFISICFEISSQSRSSGDFSSFTSRSWSSCDERPCQLASVDSSDCSASSEASSASFEAPCASWESSSVAWSESDCSTWGISSSEPAVSPSTCASRSSDAGASPSASSSCSASSCTSPGSSSPWALAYAGHASWLSRSNSDAYSVIFDCEMPPYSGLSGPFNESTNTVYSLLGESWLPQRIRSSESAARRSESSSLSKRLAHSSIATLSTVMSHASHQASCRSCVSSHGWRNTQCMTRCR